MCKICEECHGVMNYDPYFVAEVCGKCGKIERKPKEEIQKTLVYQSRNDDILKKIMGVMMVRS